MIEYAIGFFWAQDAYAEVYWHLGTLEQAQSYALHKARRAAKHPHRIIISDLSTGKCQSEAFYNGTFSGWWVREREATPEDIFIRS